MELKKIIGGNAPADPRPLQGSGGDNPPPTLQPLASPQIPGFDLDLLLQLIVIVIALLVIATSSFTTIFDKVRLAAHR